MAEQEELIPESKKFAVEKQPKEQRISMKMIAETSLDERMRQAVSEEERIELMIRLKSIHLEWLNIPLIENLDVFSDLQILYLQHNCIARIQGLDNLLQLEYLALNDNRISKVENLGQLCRLLGLNLKNNLIEEVDGKELPRQLQLLSLKDNPVALDARYKLSIVSVLGCLEMLDDQPITPEDRFKTIGVFPQHLIDYSNQLRQFQRKQLIQQQLQLEAKPLLLNTEPINEKQALSDIREKTRKYMHENKEAFKSLEQEQVDNFHEKIQVSRNVRAIKEKEEQARLQKLHTIRKDHLA